MHRALKMALGRFLLAARPWAFPEELSAWQARVLAHPRRPTDAKADAMRKRRVERALIAEGLSRRAAFRVLCVVTEEYRDAN